MGRILLLLAAACGGALAQSHELCGARLLASRWGAGARAHADLPEAWRIEKNRIHGRLSVSRTGIDGHSDAEPGRDPRDLSAPAAWFEALVGVDSNDLGYYANQGARSGSRGEVESGRCFRSPV